MKVEINFLRANVLEKALGLYKFQLGQLLKINDFFLNRLFYKMRESHKNKTSIKNR
jgi:hypothetical protein